MEVSEVVTLVATLLPSGGFIAVFIVMFRSLRADIGGLRAGVEQVRAEIGGVRGDVEQVRAEIGGVRGDVEQVRAEIGGVRGDVEQVRADISSVCSDLHNLDVRVARVETTVTHVATRVDRIEARLDGISATPASAARPEGRHGSDRIQEPDSGSGLMSELGPDAGSSRPAVTRL